MSVKLQGFISQNQQSALSISDSQVNDQGGKKTSPVVCLIVPAVSGKLLFCPSCGSGDTVLGNVDREVVSSELAFWGINQFSRVATAESY